MKVDGEATECCCFLILIQDLLADGNQHERRIDSPLDGPVFPFGTAIFYHPISSEDKSRLHPFGSTVLPGIFVRSAILAGGSWTGDLLTVDVEDFKNNPSPEIHVNRFEAKEVEVQSLNGQYQFS